MLKNLIRDSYIYPWKVSNELKRILYIPINFIYFHYYSLPFKSNWSLYGKPLLQLTRGSVVKIKSNMELRCFKSSNPLSPYHSTVISTRNRDATIKIGHNFKMSGGSIVSNKSITIGNDVTVGANSIIVDTDFHPMLAIERKQQHNNGKSKTVIIGNNVFIGANCLILKGTRIGEGAVIGAGLTVTGHIEKDSIYVGK